MSYTSVAGPSSARQMLLSFWFRVPAASLEGKGTIPLLVFGDKGKSGGTYTNEPYTLKIEYTEYEITSYPIPQFSWHGEPQTPDEFHEKVSIQWDNGSVTFGAFTGYDARSGTKTHYTAGGQPTYPSYIGIDCSGDTPQLVINLESGKKPKVEDDRQSVWAVDFKPSPGGDSDRIAWVHTERSLSGVLGVVGFVSVESSEVQTIQYFPAGDSWFFYGKDEPLPGDAASGALYNAGPTVTADEWHHLLVYADFSSVIVVDGQTQAAATLRIAYDDQDIQSNDLTYWADNGRPDAVTTAEGFRADNYQLENPGIAFAGKPLGMPANAEFAGTIKMCEMGMMQMWVGMDVGLSGTALRRLFIKEPDDNGVQRPASRKKPVEAFGRKPDISFFRLKDWRNSGTGQIDLYKPAPNLGGDQGE